MLGFFFRSQLLPICIFVQSQIVISTLFTNSDGSEVTQLTYMCAQYTLDMGLDSPISFHDVFFNPQFTDVTEIQLPYLTAKLNGWHRF